MKMSLAQTLNTGGITAIIVGLYTAITGDELSPEGVVQVERVITGAVEVITGLAVLYIRYRLQRRDREKSK